MNALVGAFWTVVYLAAVLAPTAYLVHLILTIH